jgi:hypothetical protein
MPEQSYVSHRRRTPYWLSGALVALIAFICAVVLVLREPSLLSVTVLLLAYATIVAVLCARRFALRLQDRLIRLEMHTRLARLGHDTDLARLSLRQLIALRFASDAELPGLLARAQAENLTEDQIKKAVTAWQPDHMRV